MYAAAKVAAAATPATILTDLANTNDMKYFCLYGIVVVDSARTNYRFLYFSNSSESSQLYNSFVMSYMIIIYFLVCETDCVSSF